MPEWYEVCRYCQRAFDFAGPAIVFHGIPQYESWMEGWRGGYVEIAHPEMLR